MLGGCIWLGAAFKSSLVGILPSHVKRHLLGFFLSDKSASNTRSAYDRD